MIDQAPPSAALPSRGGLAWLWGPVVLWMTAIFAASSMSDPGAVPGGLSDKSAHAFTFGVLALLLLRALARGRIQGITWRSAFAAFVIASIYGASDELHQSFVPGRSPDVLDIRADMLGACAGVTLGSMIRLFSTRGARKSG